MFNPIGFGAYGTDTEKRLITQTAPVTSTGLFFYLDAGALFVIFP